MLHDEAQGSTSVTVLIEFDRQVSFNDYKGALEQLSLRHPMLRSCVIEEGGGYHFHHK